MTAGRDLFQALGRVRAAKVDVVHTVRADLDALVAQLSQVVEGASWQIGAGQRRACVAAHETDGGVQGAGQATLAQRGPGDLGEVQIRVVERQDNERLFARLAGAPQSLSQRDYLEVAAQVIRALAQRLRRLVQTVESLALKEVRQRVAAILLQLVVERGPEFTLPASIEQMAAQLGTVREVVSRALHGFAPLRGRKVERARSWPQAETSGPTACFGGCPRTPARVHRREAGVRGESAQ